MAIAAVDAPEATSAAEPRAGRRVAIPTVPSNSRMYGSIGSQLGDCGRFTMLHLLGTDRLGLGSSRAWIVSGLDRLGLGSSRAWIVSRLYLLRIGSPLLIVLLITAIGNPAHRSDCG